MSCENCKYIIITIIIGLNEIMKRLFYINYKNKIVFSWKMLKLITSTQMENIKINIVF